MFTYINPDIRERLIRDGKLLRINSDGYEVDMADAPGPGLCQSHGAYPTATCQRPCAADGALVRQRAEHRAQRG